MTVNEILLDHLETDLGVAAFLVVRGFRVLGLDAPEGGSRYAFRFADPERLPPERYRSACKATAPPPGQSSKRRRL